VQPVERFWTGLLCATAGSIEAGLVLQHVGLAALCGEELLPLAAPVLLGLFWWGIALASAGLQIARGRPWDELAMYFSLGLCGLHVLDVLTIVAASAAQPALLLRTWGGAAPFISFCTLALTWRSAPAVPLRLSPPPGSPPA